MNISGTNSLMLYDALKVLWRTKNAPPTPVLPAVCQLFSLVLVLFLVFRLSYLIGGNGLLQGEMRSVHSHLGADLFERNGANFCECFAVASHTWMERGQALGFECNMRGLIWYLKQGYLQVLSRHQPVRFIFSVHGTLPNWLNYA